MVLVILFLLFVFQLSALVAKDLGTHGTIHLIQEESPIALIEQKLKSMEDSGELRRKQIELQIKAKSAVEKPQAVKGITEVTESRLFFYDPTYVVNEDIKDHLGRVVVSKGTKVNPLEKVKLSSCLLFIDGDDEKQTEFAQDQMATVSAQKPLRIVLIKGAPLTLSEQMDIPVYFDQGGSITKKLGIKRVPALVSQEDERLRIEEIALKKEEEPHE